MIILIEHFMVDKSTSDLNGDMEWSIEEVDAVLQLEVRHSQSKTFGFCYQCGFRPYYRVKKK